MAGRRRPPFLLLWMMGSSGLLARCAAAAAAGLQAFFAGSVRRTGRGERTRDEIMEAETARFQEETASREACIHPLRLPFPYTIGAGHEEDEEVSEKKTKEDISGLQRELRSVIFMRRAAPCTSAAGRSKFLRGSRLNTLIMGFSSPPFERIGEFLEHSIRLTMDHVRCLLGFLVDRWIEAISMLPRRRSAVLFF